MSNLHRFHNKGFIHSIQAQYFYNVLGVNTSINYHMYKIIEMASECFCIIS